MTEQSCRWSRFRDINRRMESAFK